MINVTPVRKQKPLRVLVLWNREVPEPDAELDAEDDDDVDAELEPDVDTELDAEAEEALAEAMADEHGMPADVRAVVDALREQGLDVLDVNAEDDIERVTAAMVVERPAMVFNLIDAFHGDITQHTAVAAYLDLLGTPYTGSDPLCLATCQDRVRAHLLLADASVPVPGFKAVRDVNAVGEAAGLRMPLIVTQALDDVYEHEGLERPLSAWHEVIARVAELATEYDLPFLIEEYIEYRRVHAVVVGNRSLEVLPLVELSEADDEEPEDELEYDAAGEPHDEDEDELEDDEDDLEDDEDDLAPEPAWMLAQLDHDTADRIRELARRAFRVLGCRDYAQIDFHIDTDGQPYVVDVRALTDLGPTGALYTAAESTARGFAGTMAEIVRVAHARTRADGAEEEVEPEADPASAHR